MYIFEIDVQFHLRRLCSPNPKLSPTLPVQKALNVFQFFFTPAQIYYCSALLWFGTFCVIFFFCFHCSDWDVNHIFHGTFEWGRKITTMEGRMVSYFYFFEIFSTPIFCGKYFGGLCMLSASDRREAAAQIFEIEDILSEYLLTFFWNI